MLQHALQPDLEMPLLRAARGGSSEAFAQLVGQYSVRLLRVAMSLTRNREDSEDVVQAALLKAYMGLGQFREESRFYTWLVRITMNEGLMKLRERHRHCTVSFSEACTGGENESESPQFVDRDEDPEQRFSRLELQRILAGASAAVSPAHLLVVHLRDFECLSAKTVGEFLRVPLSTVKSRLHRGRRRLREYLNQHCVRTGRPQPRRRALFCEGDHEPA